MDEASRGSSLLESYDTMIQSVCGYTIYMLPTRGLSSLVGKFAGSYIR